MNLSGLLPSLTGSDRLQAALDALARGGPGPDLLVPDAAKPAVAAALAERLGRPVLVLTPRPDQARSLAEEAAAWLGHPDRVLLFPEREALPYERLSPDREAGWERLRILMALAAPGTGPAPLVVACGHAAAQRTVAPDRLARARVEVRAGEALDLPRFLLRLTELGYQFVPQVEEPGQASRRGGIVDVYSPAAGRPVRIDLWGDTVDSLRLFDPATQRSGDRVEAYLVGPARELLEPQRAARALLERLDLSRTAAEVAERVQHELSVLAEGGRLPGDHFYTPFLAPATLLEHLPEEAVLLLSEPAEIRAILEELESQAAEVRDDMAARGELPDGMPLPHAGAAETLALAGAHPRRAALRRWSADLEERPALDVGLGPAASYGARLRAVVSEALAAARTGAPVVIVSQQAGRLAELFREEGPAVPLRRDVTEPPPPGSLTLVQGMLAGGWTLEGRLTVLTDAEIFGFTKQRRPVRTARAERAAFLSELTVGDYVAHVEHGIARFAGVVRKAVDGVEREYLELHYAEGDRIFVPTDQLDRVTRWVGPSDRPPALSRLGSGEWARTKERVRRAVTDLAQELLHLYAAREVTPGHAFPPDTPWQQELEASFPYVETPDQTAVLREIKADMEAPRPMDRLVCGDVGYGKTELAVRAAFKAVMDGMQVAVLVPTTVLAQQHGHTFTERLRGFPVRVEVLSRFRSEREQREVVRDLALGQVDIVIGTHRLLQKDVTFKNLGLVIIDEEQRFGVAHKERLKQMRQNVDVLALSATPIPRTLHMSLTGIRDMSVLATPPEDRLPIKTYVAESDDRLIREAILRELDRGGQVYFVHNRVHNIHQVARRLQALVPEAEFGIGHGQMPEHELAEVMERFTRGEIDVLVCTTIIESGLDIPNVNTIIINRAESLGLAQLYQLRGRVGRGAVRAYAYLLHEPHRALTEPAQKRLQAIFEATELGAGFQIALRDLEIRGAGNLLGAEQSGHISAVGFELYSRMLTEAVERLRAVQRGVTPPVPSTARPPLTLDLPLSAFLPEPYVPDLNVRLNLYQRLAGVTDPEEADALEEELADRFGPVPEAARNLLYVVRVRILARRVRAASITVEDGLLVLRLSEEAGEIPSRAALQRTLQEEGLDGVRLSRTQVRIDLRRWREGWQRVLLAVLTHLVRVQPAQEVAAPA